MEVTRWQERNCYKCNKYDESKDDSGCATTYDISTAYSMGVLVREFSEETLKIIGQKDCPNFGEC